MVSSVHAISMINFSFIAIPVAVTAPDSCSRDNSAGLHKVIGIKCLCVIPQRPTSTPTCNKK